MIPRAEAGIDRESALASDTVTDLNTMLGVLGLVKLSLSERRPFGVLSRREAGPWQRVVLGMATEAILQCLDNSEPGEPNLSFGDIVFESGFKLGAQVALPSNSTSPDLPHAAADQIPVATDWLRDAFDNGYPLYQLREQLVGRTG